MNMNQRRVKNYKKMIFFAFFTFVFLLSALPAIETSTTTVAPAKGAHNDSLKTSALGPMLIIFEPNGANWDAGSTYTIEWFYEEVSNYMKIELHLGGGFYRDIANNIYNDGVNKVQYSWQIPENVMDSNDYQIKVIDTSEVDVWRTTSSFNINSDYAGGIDIKNPTSSTIWDLGAWETIRWYYDVEQTHPMKIQLYKAGAFLQDIAPNAQNYGEYLWNIPLDLEDGSDYKIKIIDGENSDIRTISSSFYIGYPICTPIRNNLQPTNLLPGDIIVSKWATFIPGYNSHAFIYCGKVQEGEKIWDRNNLRWMLPGMDYVIHAHADYGHGLGYSPWSFVNCYYDAWVLRVLNLYGNPITASTRNAVVNWAKNELEGGLDGYPVGPDYDYDFSGKSTSGDVWYCSEIVWAAYKMIVGIDLDANKVTGDWNGGVAPDDLFYSQYTSVIAMAGSFNVPSTIAKVTVCVDSVYYYDDNEAGGAGEMFLYSSIGLLGYKATQEYYPGGPIGEDPGPCWVRSGPGYLYWNKKFTVLMPKGQTFGIGIKAGEDDIGDFDWYIGYANTWTSSVWMGRLNKPWKTFANEYDVGDCRYSLRAKVESAY